ncbi:MAG: family 16 glycosylhydrolase [Bacteroidetes bacterium]|nr:family 16 glycosylhydrolase [Bacteroidota bacterium]
MKIGSQRNGFPAFLGLVLITLGCSECGDVAEPMNSEIQFVSDKTALENAFNSTFDFEVRLDASNTREVTVDYQTELFTEGLDCLSASPGEDFIQQEGQLVFAPGEIKKTISIEVVIDEVLESEERFNVVLSNPTNGFLKGNQQVATGSILNDDTDITIDLPVGGYDTPHSPSSPPEGMTLVWADEFDGPAIDMNNWTHELGSGGWGNDELQTYTDDPQSSYISDGNLVIVAAAEATGYTSARMVTRDKQEFAFGRIDIRALLPKGQGLWPALWMLGANHGEVGWPACGEIDIMELLGHQPNVVHGTAHWGAMSGGGHPNLGSVNFADVGTDFSEEYHVFSLNWSPDTMTWLMNDEPYFQLTTDEHVGLSGFETPFNDPFFFIFNIAVGGSWPGNPDECTLFPQFMAVDYVRVYQ